MTLLPSGYLLSRVEIPELEGSELANLVSVVNLLRTEREPRAVDLTPEDLKVFATSPGNIRLHHMVSDQRGRPVGYLVLYHADDGSNPSLLGVDIGVLPEHRRRGIARGLLGHAVDAADRLGRSVLRGDVHDTVPAAQAFAASVGAISKLDMHYNVVRIEHLDTGMLGEWVQDGAGRAPGYRVEVIEGLYPDYLLEGMARLYLILERDSPRPEGREPHEWSPEFVRSWLDSFLQAVDLITAVVIEDRSGSPVGMSQLGRRRSDWRNWFVTTTMVDPAHRGRALGKWVKAASCLAALERWPRAEWMETSNAFTNEPMLAINHAMGFRHELTISEVEVSVEEARRYLAATA